jgi:5'-3' exonuclease
MKYLILDISNLLYRTFFAHTTEDDITITGLATHSALVTINKYFKQHKPDKIVMCFDRSSWRKVYTSSDLCVSKKPYKGNRRQKMSPSQQIKYQKFIDHLNEFENLIIKHSTIITLAKDYLEADDLIAGFIQAHPNDEIVLISSDTDFVQLLKYKNVKIISPKDDKEHNLEEYNNDPDFYLFCKCMRGDPTDNIQSAYPRVSSKRLKKAYEDPFERVKLMKEIWSDHEKREFVVEKIFEENQLLIDLEKQPEEIRKLIDKTIEEETSKTKKYSHFHFMKFLGKYELDAIAKNVDQYIKLLSR